MSVVAEIFVGTLATVVTIMTILAGFRQFTTQGQFDALSLAAMTTVIFGTWLIYLRAKS